MKIKTSELEGAALDWAVALAAYPASYVSGDRLRVRAVIDGEEETIASVFRDKPKGMLREFKPSTDWSQGGPLIEANNVAIVNPAGTKPWIAMATNTKWTDGPTPLIAACRAIVSAKLGVEVEIPDELA